MSEASGDQDGPMTCVTMRAELATHNRVMRHSHRVIR
jgi:hypothetical protein